MKQRRYLGRVQSIPHVFQAAAADLALKQQQEQEQEKVLLGQLQGGGDGSIGEEEFSPEVVTAVWNLLLPGEQGPAPLPCCWLGNALLLALWRGWLGRNLLLDRPGSAQQPPQHRPPPPVA